MSSQPPLYVMPFLKPFFTIRVPVSNVAQSLIEAGPPNVILLRENPNENIVSGTFDYSDLNAYLLVVVGLAHPDQGQREDFDFIVKRAKENTKIPLRDIEKLGKKEPLVTLYESDDLSKAMEHFGSGIHRILVCKNQSTEVVGILSQLKLVKFLWDNGASFPTIDQLYPLILKDLQVGVPSAVSIKYVGTERPRRAVLI